MEQCLPLRGQESERDGITLQQLIEKLHIIFANDRIDADEVHGIMESYKSSRADWEKYASFDPYRYSFPFLILALKGVLLFLGHIYKHTILYGAVKVRFKLYSTVRNRNIYL